MTSIERRVDLDAPAEEVWPLLAEPEGWSRWLADEADVDVEPGGGGRVIEDGEVRRVAVDDVEAGRRVAFRWWPEGDRSDESHVELVLVPAVGSIGRSTVVITETRGRTGVSPTAELRLWLACTSLARV